VRWGAAWIAVSLSLLLSGCLTSHTDTWIGDAPSPETRDELYRLYGPPDAIRRHEGRLYLRYDSSVAKGMTLGARAGPRWIGVGLVLSRTRSVGDRVWVEVAPDGRVVDVDPLRASDRPRYRLWPFSR
jgi:hypothetical protein